MTATSPCVLVIDDEAGAREVICETLEAAGCSTLSAGDGKEARDRLEGMAKTPCVILLDLMMPGMNGWDFREWQKSDPRFSNVPVVVLSAVRDLPAEALRLQASGYLEKPVGFGKLLAAVEKHCGPCEAA